MFSIQTDSFSIECSRRDATLKLSQQLQTLLDDKYKNKMELIILCIGTDRSTGDCLGPLVGDKLSRLRLNQSVTVLGTLKEPVHAKNIEELRAETLSQKPNSLIIAIDASLGRSESVGKISLHNGPVYPGSGVNKKLEPIGDISITGIVNISGFMEYIVLQSTRLSLVMQMADIISTTLYLVVSKLLPYHKPITDSLVSSE